MTLLKMFERDGWTIVYHKNPGACILEKEGGRQALLPDFELKHAESLSNQSEKEAFDKIYAHFLRELEQNKLASVGFAAEHGHFKYEHTKAKVLVIFKPFTAVVEDDKMVGTMTIGIGYLGDNLIKKSEVAQTEIA